MSMRVFTTLLIAFLAARSPDAAAGTPATLSNPAIGEAAPDFTLSSTTGETLSLTQHRGKIVVLEWFNPDCPFVRHAYSQGSLGKLAARWTAQDVAWIRINSGSPGKQGADPQRNRAAEQDWKLQHPVFLAPTGKVGKLYGATTTPHMFVIDPSGLLVYAGALDNEPLGKASGPVRHYVDEILNALHTGKPAPFSRQKPYGCSVKY